MQYKWTVLTNTTIGTLMASLDTNIVLIALPTIARELPGTTIITLLWVLLGYSLITSVLVLNFGRLGDIFGRVRLYTLGFALFVVGSGLCGLSQTGSELVGFRLVQGVGAALLFANSAALITDAFPANERGMALGVNQVSLVVGSVSGLVLGGALTSLVGWRWIFYVNVPIGIYGTLRAHYVLREIAQIEQGQRIDWVGNLTFGGGLALLLLTATFWALGQASGALVYAGLGAGAALLLAFAVLELRVRYPLFDLSLFRVRLFSASAAAMLLNAVARGAYVFTLVFFLQGPPHDLSPLIAGLYLVPVSASLATLGPISGTLSDRYGSRPFAVGGLVVSAVGFLLLTQVGPTTTFPQLVLPFLCVGAGMGIFASPNRASLMNSVPPVRRGVASGIGTTLVNTGVTVSLAVAILVMSRVMSLGALQTIFLGLTSGGASASLAIGSFMSAVHLVFLIGAILLLISTVPAALRGAEHPPPPPQPRGAVVLTGSARSSAGSPGDS